MAVKKDTVFEHRDEEGLPVGTRIFFIGSRKYVIRPNVETTIDALPDIVIVGDDDDITTTGQTPATDAPEEPLPPLSI